jgi:hypothetical protein
LTRRLRRLIGAVSIGKLYSHQKERPWVLLRNNTTSTVEFASERNFGF